MGLEHIKKHLEDKQMTQLIDGKKISQEIKDELREKVAELKERL